MRTRRMKVSKLAMCSNVPADAIRHYSDMDLLQPKRDPSNGYKIYQAADVERVRFIYKIKTLGFTLTEIGQILSHADKGTPPRPDVCDMVQKRIDENRQKVNELVILQTLMENALNQWRTLPEKAPNRESISHLIESVAKNIDED